MNEKQEREFRQFNSVSALGATMNSANTSAPPAYETWAACDLYDGAREHLIEGYAFMTKTELIHALRARS